MRATLSILFAACAALLPPAVAAQGTLDVRPVAHHVYAIVGELGNRSAGNLGNNATFGFVVTDAGVVLIDAGATQAGAEAIATAIRTVTEQPVVTVINTGGQDHRWLGNDHFRRQGARIIASEAAVADQRARVADQLFALTSLVGEAAVQATTPAHADTTFAEQLRITIGGTEFDIRHPGPAHTPGDSFVWLPQTGVVFTGDIVYTERLLGVIQVSSSARWLDAFDAVADLQPAVVVPGHGQPTDLASARRDTRDYLAFLREAVAAFMADGGDIADVGRIDQARFAALRNHALLAGRNAQRVYSELEWE